MDTGTSRVVLILADISGYTRFMLANQTAVVHAQMVITKLLEEIIREVEIPLQVKEVEGDAVFLYAIRPDDEIAWQETRRSIRAKLASFFQAFSRGILVGSEFALCSCPSCRNVDQLKLKLVVHSGEAVAHKVGDFSDLSGVDVILAHRLLKNSVPSQEYVLMTEAACRDVGFPDGVEVLEGEEHYEGFGRIPTYTQLMGDVAGSGDAEVEQLYERRGRAFATGLRMLGKGYFGQLQILLGLGSTGDYRNLGGARIRPLARAALLLRVIALAPILVPLGAGIQAYRALARRTLSARRGRAAPIAD
jgi:hypothetical protein